MASKRKKTKEKKKKFLKYKIQVYENGKVCISILHPPGEDQLSGERPEERWLPVQTPESILLSVITMICDPNISSPANVDASVEFRKDKESFNERVKKLVELSIEELPKDFEMPKIVKKKKTPLLEDDYFYNEDDYEFEVEEFSGTDSIKTDDLNESDFEVEEEDEEENDEKLMKIDK